MSLAYRTGTIAIANGGSTLTGTTTAWLANVTQGDFVLLPDGKFYEVAAAPTTNTSLTIVGAYAGTTVASGGLYAIFRYSPDWHDVSQLSVRIAGFLASTTAIYSASGVPDNSLGGDNSAYFRQDLPYLYFKSGGVWGSPINLTGPQGPAGPTTVTTSTTSLAIGAGAKSLTAVVPSQGLAFAIGTRIRLAAAAAPTTQYMEGVITAFNGTTGAITFTSDNIKGSGTVASWTISLGGDIGPIGPQGAGFATTSTTSLAIATGTKAFTVATGLAYSVGQRARAASAADTTNFMEGRVAGYSGATLTLTVDVIGGSGTKSDWAINVAGSQGIQGSTGATGSTGPTGPTGPGYLTSSTTSLTIATGSKVFTVAAGLAYSAGARVRAASSANPSVNYMDGFVASYSGTTLTITVDTIGGSGTLADWAINLLGPIGPTGPTGPVGPAPSYTTTSTTSVTVGTGSKVFTVAAGLPYLIGDRLRATSESDATKVMSGLVASYSSTTLTLTVDLIGSGSGSATDWNINLTGEKGDTGPSGGFGIDTALGTIPAADGSQFQALARGSDGALLQSDSTQTLGLVYRSAGAALASGTRVVTDVPSAATCDIGAATTDYVNITGTTTITSLGTSANKKRYVRFAAALLLTYNATSLKLPGSASITTAAGDEALFASDGSGNWKCIEYSLASANPQKYINAGLAQSFTATEQGQARANIYAALFDAMSDRDLVVNGSMRVSQENIANSVTLTASASVQTKYTVDQFGAIYRGTFVAAAQQVTDAPAGYENSLKLTVSTAQVSMGVSDELSIVTPIEGNRFSRMAFGSASARRSTIGFWVKANRTGTYSGSVRNVAVGGASPRCYPFTFTISAANTWEFKTVALAGDTSGTWGTGTNVGAYLNIAIAAGTSRVGTAAAWAANDFSGATSTTNGVAAVTDTFQMTGVSWLPTSAAADLMTSASAWALQRNLPDDLRLCQRYWSKSCRQSVAPADGVNRDTDGVRMGGSAISTTGTYSNIVSFPAPMRVAPSMTFWRSDLGATAGQWAYFISSWVSATATAATTLSETAFGVVLTGTFTANTAVGVAGIWAASARMTI